MCRNAGRGHCCANRGPGNDVQASMECTNVTDLQRCQGRGSGGLQRLPGAQVPRYTLGLSTASQECWACAAAMPAAVQTPSRCKRSGHPLLSPQASQLTRSCLRLAQLPACWLPSRYVSRCTPCSHPVRTLVTTTCAQAQPVCRRTPFAIVLWPGLHNAPVSGPFLIAPPDPPLAPCSVPPARRASSA